MFTLAVCVPRLFMMSFSKSDYSAFCPSKLLVALYSRAASGRRLNLCSRGHACGRLHSNTSKVKMLKLIVLTAALAACAHAYSSGAPESACQDMVPKHPVAPQKSAAPYTVTTSTKVVKAGTSMEVVITGRSPKDLIRGLMLQARKGDKPVGTFKLASNMPFAQLLNCGQPGNAITHKKHDAQFDKQSLAFTWTPPAGFNDEVKFRATIALNGAVFWVGVESAPIKVTN